MGSGSFPVGMTAATLAATRANGSYFAGGGHDRNRPQRVRVPSCHSPFRQQDHRIECFAFVLLCFVTMVDFHHFTAHAKEDSSWLQFKNGLALSQSV